VTTDDLQRERIASEARHWVRTARVCNNRCAFCLDSDVQDGSLLPREEIEGAIRSGLEQGAERLILSGGEATIHPDFVHFVRYGRSSGYGHVQVITNGRMFAYPRFLAAALDAGLGEITFSLHGHEAELHDELTGVPGSFRQTVQGIRNAVASRRCVVSGDVVINRRNVEQLRAILELLGRLGVREYDLLMVVPFGRAAPGAGQEMLFDAVETLPHLHRALDLCRDPALHLWTNRVDPALLEGYEPLIQDPHKLHDEIRGRRDILGDLVEGRPMRCAGQRCAHCFVRPLCEAMTSAVSELAGGVPGILLADGPDPADLVAGRRRVLWLRAAGASEAARRGEGALAERLWLELDDLRGVRGELARAGLGQPLRIVLRSADQLAEAVRLAPDELALPARAEIAAALSGFEIPPATRTLAFAPPDASLQQAAERGAAATDSMPGVDRWIGEPPCRCGSSAPRYEDPLPLSVIGGDGRLDPDAFVDHFVARLYRVKSLRCRSCVHDPTCRGLAIQRVRLQGLATLQPVPGS